MHFTIEQIVSSRTLFIKQAFELAELFGFETRNKYRILNESGQDVAFAAEQQKGLLGTVLRQIVGHWRSFDLHFYSTSRQLLMTATHPFRWYFYRFEVKDAGGRLLGVIERRFSFFSKRFEVRDAREIVIMSVSSPFWRVWTFPFRNQGVERARISKKWAGVFSELFTDKDGFLIEYPDPALDADGRALVLAAAVYIDLMYFEKKGND